MNSVEEFRTGCRGRPRARGPASPTGTRIGNMPPMSAPARPHARPEEARP
jgi:hypothetical protein